MRLQVQRDAGLFPQPSYDSANHPNIVVAKAGSVLTLVAGRAGQGGFLPVSAGSGTFYRIRSIEQRDAEGGTQVVQVRQNTVYPSGVLLWVPADAVVMGKPDTAPVPGPLPEPVPGPETAPPAPSSRLWILFSALFGVGVLGVVTMFAWGASRRRARSTSLPMLPAASPAATVSGARRRRRWR